MVPVFSPQSMEYVEKPHRQHQRAGPRGQSTLSSCQRYSVKQKIWPKQPGKVRLIDDLTGSKVNNTADIRVAQASESGSHWCMILQILQL